MNEEPFDAGDGNDRYRELLQRHHSLQTAHGIERRLARLVGGPGGAQALVDACLELTGKVVALYGADDRVV